MVLQAVDPEDLGRVSEGQLMQSERCQAIQALTSGRRTFATSASALIGSLIEPHILLNVVKRPSATSPLVEPVERKGDLSRSLGSCITSAFSKFVNSPSTARFVWLA